MSKPTPTWTSRELKAPFPYFGGKSRVADVIWQRFGNVPNFVDPFCGSLATLLGRPHLPQTETVNDADCYLANFWRALKAAPEEVAEWADWPVSEVDLLSRHRWLMSQQGVCAKAKADPDWYDAKIAGWWVWGACSWIGQGWCVQRGNGNQPGQLPHLGNAGMGINRKLPHLGNAGRGINRKLPHLGNAGMGTSKGDAILLYFCELADRLRNVRIACGDWSRVLGPSVTFRHGTTAILLDPPYGEGAMEYSAGGNSTNIAQDVAAWAIENGSNAELRIAYCGYEGAVSFPASWECHAWKNRGGYGSQGDGEGRDNARRERIWFSPACINRTSDCLPFAEAV
jgi:DNA adenine methylase